MKLRSRSIRQSSAPPPTTSKRRRVEASTDQQTVSLLTKRNLKHHTREAMSKHSFSDMSGSKYSSHTSTNHTSSSDPALGMKLRRNGVVHDRLKAVKPTDHADLQAELDRRRQSGSPESEDYQRYVYEVENVTNEDSLKNTTFTQLLLKRPVMNPDEPYMQVSNQEWTNIVGNPVRKNISNPKPDYYESYTLSNYNDDAVEMLNGSIQPTKHHHAMPRLTAEFKNPSVGERQAYYQAAYDGAVMVGATRSQCEYIGNQFEYGKTQALTVTSNGYTVGIQAHHLLEDNKSYHCFSMSNNLPMESKQHFSMTRRRVRNAQKWAQTKSKEMLDAINEVRACPPTSHGTKTSTTSSEIAVRETGKTSKKVKLQSGKELAG